MTRVHDDLMTAIDAVEIVSPAHFRLLGELRDVGEQGLAATLATDLYERLYIRPSMRPMARSDGLSRRDLMMGLSAANSGQGHWASGWSVRRVADDGRVVVAREDIAWWAQADAVRTVGASIRLGDRCRVRMPKELRRWSRASISRSAIKRMTMTPTRPARSRGSTGT